MSKIYERMVFWGLGALFATIIMAAQTLPPHSFGEAIFLAISVFGFAIGLNFLDL